MSGVKTLLLDERSLPSYYCIENVVSCSGLFKGRIPPPQRCASQGLSILKHFKQVEYSKPPRVVVNKIIDKYGAWAYYDRGRGLLYLYGNHCFEFKASLGRSSNNKVELNALKLMIDVKGGCKKKSTKNSTTSMFS